MANTHTYVVHGDFVWDADEWDNSPDSQRYDDIKRCVVDLDHPTYPKDWDKIEDDLVNYWKTGLKPIYVK